jgi:pimeloyl-ACP methyl ester carboxylesterase
LNISTVPGTTHFLPLERPDLVRQALADAAA